MLSIQRILSFHFLVVDFQIKFNIALIFSEFFRLVVQMFLHMYCQNIRAPRPLVNPARTLPSSSAAALPLSLSVDLLLLFAVSLQLPHISRWCAASDPKQASQLRSQNSKQSADVVTDHSLCCLQTMSSTKTSGEVSYVEQELENCV